MGIITFIKAHQLNIMLFLSGICGILACLTNITGALSRRRRYILCLLELSAMLLLMCDRFAYIYRGNVSPTGYWMVRICNFMVYLCTLVVTHSVTLYLCDLYKNEGKLEVLPKRLSLCKVLFSIGVVLLVVSQFTGLYYSFDAQNQYQRAPGNIICYVIPVVIVLLQQTVVLQYRKCLSRMMTFFLIMNSVVPVAASIIQAFVYGISLINMTIVSMAILLYYFALIDLNNTLRRAQISEIETYREAQKRERALFEQTAEALASAIDAKDKYTHGHSSRVAIYSQMIARESGMSEEECDRVYFAALLHDVGKIGINDAIITKEGRLTEEEYAQIKRHPVFGDRILSRIQQSPYLSIGAHYHHERYDGKGYPDGLVGEDIPRIARIISVADSYDAMTSRRSYRDTRPQQQVREELVKGMGTQFDPQYAKIMLHWMDRDLDYRMREQIEGIDTTFETRLHCESIYHDCSTGILVTDAITRIQLYCTGDEGFSGQEAMPSLILFDALDARVHESEARRKDLLYLEYAQIRFDGRVICAAARKTQTVQQDAAPQPGQDTPRTTHYRRYEIEAVRERDHVQIRISGQGRTIQTIIALPDNGRFAYLSMTGEHCLLSNIRVVQDKQTIENGYIQRIAEEVSYIRDCPQGDIPNIQIDSWRGKSTQSIPLAGVVHLTFHTQSLPTARLVWHCPFISIFTSKDGSVNGEAFREFVLIRLDGENWESDAHAQNNVIINRTQGFEGWNVWKERNRQGMDCEVTIRRDGNTVTVTTENLGIAIKSVTNIIDEVADIYAALTGDQCAITNIRVSMEK